MLAYFKVVGPGLVYLMPFEGPIDPGFGVGEGHPDQGLPHPGRPIDPGFGVGGGRPIDPGFGNRPGHRPDNSLPAIPGVPDNSLPSTPPPQVAPGHILVIVRGADGKWRWASAAAPPTPLHEVPPAAQPKG